MKLRKVSDEFNLKFIEALRGVFGPAITPVESEDGTLLFRGPIPIPDDPKHIGSHVAVSLSSEVRAALDRALPAERDEMTEKLIESLGGQIRARYNPNKHGEFALDFVGTKSMIDG